MPLTLDRQNAYRARYAHMHSGWQPATAVYEALIRQTLSKDTAYHTPPILLDLGCGRGGVLEQIADLPLRAVGLDPDYASLAEHRLPGLPRAVALAEAIPLPPASADVIISAWVLEHLPDPAHVFREVGRVLRPGGAFVFLTPNRNSLIALLNRALRPLQNALVPRLYGRAEADTFPVRYCANTCRQIKMLACAGGLRLETFHAITDPTYLAFAEPLFHLSVALAWVWPAAMQVHLVGVCRKTE